MPLIFISIFLKFYIGLESIYNVMLALGLQKSDSVIYSIFFSLFSHIGYYRVLSRVPCVMQ